MTGEQLEPILDPELEITDAHVHLYDDRPNVPPYVLNELIQDARSGHKVTEAVFVQCGWDRLKYPPETAPVGEVRRVVQVAEESVERGATQVTGIVGFADFRQGEAVADAVDALIEAGGPRLVGLRQSVPWDDSVPQWHWSRLGPKILGDERVRVGLGCLHSRSLTYETWLFHPQLPELTDLAHALPDQPIILDHLGGPLSVGDYEHRGAEVREQWRTSMTGLAKCPNVLLKIGGLGMAKMYAEELRGVAQASSIQLAEIWGEPIRWCIEEFGVERCMFESNFPVDKEHVTYRALWNAFKRIVADFSPAEKASLFRDTAHRAYGLPTANTASWST